MTDKAAILNELIQATSLPIREPNDIDIYEYAEAAGGISPDLARKWLKQNAEELGFIELTVYDLERKSRIQVWRKVEWGEE